MSRAAGVAHSLRAYAALDLVEFHHAGHLASFTFDAEVELRLRQAETSVLSAQILAFRFPWRGPGYMRLSEAAEDLRLSEATAEWRALTARCDVAHAAEVAALRRAVVVATSEVAGYVSACRVGD